MTHMSRNLSRMLVLLPVALAGLTYIVYLQPKAIEEVLEVRRLHLLLVCYWVTVVVALLCLLRVRRHPKLIIASVIATILLLFPQTETVLVLTTWSIKGFAP